MSKRSSQPEDPAALRQKIIGLGEYSFRKSYYPELQRRLQAVQDAERRTREALALVDTLLASAPVGFALLDCDLQMIRVNDALADIRRVPPEELLGQTPREAFPGLAAAIEPALYHAMETGEPSVNLEATAEVPPGSGGMRSFLMSCYPVRTAAGELLGVGVVTSEITERKHWEEELRESEELFRTLSAAAPIGIFRMDAAGRCTYVNTRWQEITGMTASQGMGMGWLDSIHPEDRGSLMQAWLKTAHEGGEWSREVRLCRPQGEVRWAQAQATPMLRPDGHLAGYVGTIQDVTERKRAEEERAELLRREQAARSEAQEANAAKDQFLAVLSHELRNPLSPILAGVSLLQRTLPADSPAQRTLAIIDRNAKLQARLTNDLLDLSRIARGKLELRRAPVLLESAVCAAVDAVRDDLLRAGLTLETELQPGVWVCGDVDRLQQIVLNLLTNAVKFTPAGGRVSVRVARTDDRGRIIVEDTGIGIEPDLLRRLFDMFEQGEVGGKRMQGLGIGLALVKRMAEMHGGTVWAESEGPGKGSRLTVEIPLTQSPEGEGAAGSAAGPPEAISLLLVEDNADTRTLLEDALDLAGYQTHSAASGEEALELLRRIRPDVIVADIGLPGIDGYEFLRRAHAIPGHESTPAIAVTGYGQESDVHRAEEAGFADHLIKPVDAETIDRHIRDLRGAALRGAQPGSSRLRRHALWYNGG